MEIQIQKLKKRLLREELRRRRKNSRGFRLLVAASLALLLLALGGLIWYVANRDTMLAGDYAAAETQLEQGNYAGAADGFRRFYENHPSFHLAPQALFQSAEVLNLYLKRYPEALLCYLQVEQEYPSSPWAGRAIRQVAEIYKNRLRDFPKAIVVYQKLIDAGAEGADRLRYELADCYFRLENYEQARIEFENLLRQHPDSQLLAEVQYRIAVAWSLEGRLREAEGAFRQLIERWPDSSYATEGRFALATTLEERDELREALKLLEGLQGSYPNTEVLAKKIEQVKDRLKKKKGV
jgi:TolA-binding protein